MALPPSLLLHVEQHGCFTGCYGAASDVRGFFNPLQPPTPMLMVSCQDCLSYLAVPTSLLASGTTSSGLADHLTQHVRGRRGFALSTSGWHTQGPGFWFSAVYWANCNLFLLNGERSRSLGNDLDILMLSFRHGVLKPSDPGMLTATRYAIQTVYVDPSQPLPVVSSKTALVNAPTCRTQAVAGWQRLTLAEFLPAGAQPAAAATPPSTAVARKPMKIGDRCPTCGADVRVRYLLKGSYIGCLC
jgi:hypothetical protein